MAGIVNEKYQTRTVDPDAYQPYEEKSGPPPDDQAMAASANPSENDPTVAVPQDNNLIDGASAAKYGPPDGYNGYTPPGAAAGYQSGAPPVVPSDVDVDVPLFKQKKILDAYILGIGLGFFGAHHFYLRRYGFGMAYFFTFGFLGCGYVLDLFRMPCLVNHYNRTRARGKVDNKARLDDAYVCWFPFGLFGKNIFLPTGLQGEVIF